MTPAQLTKKEHTYMGTKFEKLNIFFDRIKTIGFWQRIFQWRQISILSYDAYQEFKELVSLFDNATAEVNKLKSSVAVLNNDNEHLKTENIKQEAVLKSIEEKCEAAESNISGLKASTASKDETIRLSERKINERENELVILKEEISHLNSEILEVSQENTAYKQSEADRQSKYEKEAATLTAIRDQIQSERQNELNDRQEMEIANLRAMKETWEKHQESVENAMKSICQKHIIEYLDQVPFKGKPDNTLKICDEFVIFDAKSPSTEDLSNFPAYVKSQTESVKKYIKEENVRRDIFLVVPSNTVHVIDAFSYNMGDYNVYVVTIDVLEPLILSLKKIEEYKFVNELSPEERENICRIIGKFAHMTKRRIQIDHFFARQFLEILTKCEAELPEEIFDKVSVFEQSEKLNPPQEKRAKQILTKNLESDTGKIQKEAEAKAIVFPLSIQNNFKSIPLYENEKDPTETPAIK